MRRLIYSTYITLDGVIEGPQLWPSLGPRDERWEQIQADLLLSCDALVMGRRTYEGFAPVWPTRELCRLRPEASAAARVQPTCATHV